LQNRTEKLGYVLGALTNARIVLPVRDFISVLLGDTKEATAVAANVFPHVTAAYESLLDSGEAAFANNVFTPVTKSIPTAIQNWANKFAADYSLAKEHAQRRARLASIRCADGQNNVILKVASSRPATRAAAALAKQYALYKIASLAAMQSFPDFNWLLQLANIQDFSCE
jgi:hypothetical protein